MTDEFDNSDEFDQPIETDEDTGEQEQETYVPVQTPEDASLMQIDTMDEQNTPEWLFKRRGKITGTKASALTIRHYAQKDAERQRGLQTKNLLLAGAATNPKKKQEYADKAAEYGAKADQYELDNQRLNVNDQFWQIQAETQSDPDEIENESARDRGHRLEPENIKATLRKLHIDPATCNYGRHDPGIFIKPGTMEQASPDAYESVTDENGNMRLPTWVIECKSPEAGHHYADVLPIIMHRAILEQHWDLLDPEEAKQKLDTATLTLLDVQDAETKAQKELDEDDGKDKKTTSSLKSALTRAKKKTKEAEGTHDKAMDDDMHARAVIHARETMPDIVFDPAARDYDFIPSSDYKGQVLQYFNVDPMLQTVYFSIYNPQMYNDVVSHVILTITRGSIEDDLEDMREGHRHVTDFNDVFSYILPPFGGIH